MFEIIDFPCINSSSSIRYCIIDIYGWSFWQIYCNNAKLWVIKCISIFLNLIFSPFYHMKWRGCNNVYNAILVQGRNGNRYNSCMGTTILYTTLSLTCNGHNWDFQYINMFFNLLSIQSINNTFAKSTPNGYPKCR